MQRDHSIYNLTYLARPRTSQRAGAVRHSGSRREPLIAPDPLSGWNTVGQDQGFLPGRRRVGRSAPRFGTSLPVDRGTRVFWGLIFVLLGAGVFFAFNAETRRRSVQAKKAATVQTGEIVSFVRAVDGDSIVVLNPTGERVSVRLLGVKAFAHEGKNATAVHGRAAFQMLEQKLTDKAIRVRLETTDKHGRAIAELFVENQNLGRTMVREGLVLVYTVYPFNSMTDYLEEQATARAEKKGLWGNSETVKQAELLGREWQRQSE